MSEVIASPMIITTPSPTWVLTSKRFWGYTAAFLAVFLPWANTQFGLNIDLVAVTGLGEAVITVMESIVGVSGFALALYGSWVGRGPLVLSKSTVDQAAENDKVTVVVMEQAQESGLLKKVQYNVAQEKTIQPKYVL